MQAIHWYPGHIARAKQQLNRNLDKVDLVIEVRDARIPLATGHTHLQHWTCGKKHLLVINRLDMIPPEARRTWDRWFRDRGEKPRWCNARVGVGVKEIQQAAVHAGAHINERRRRRGMLARPIRALALGFPNVGKSALINRLVQQRIVASSRRPGITRVLRWVRIGQDLDLLDSPGVLPPRLNDQQAALYLALCDDIGQGAYDDELVARALLMLLQKLTHHNDAGVDTSLLLKRYGVALANETADPTLWLVTAAARHTAFDVRRMARRLLDDFRRLALGPIALELPPEGNYVM